MEEKEHQSWLDGPLGVPEDRETIIPLTVTGGKDHPGAIISALHARKVVDAYRRYADLDKLNKYDSIDILVSARRLAQQARSLEETSIINAWCGGASWDYLSNALDMDAKSARMRFNRIVDAHMQGYTEDAVREHTTAQIDSITPDDDGDELI